MQFISMIPMITQLLDYAIHQAELLKAKGEITAEQLADVMQRANISDARWDDAVAAAKARIAAGGD